MVDIEDATRGVSETLSSGCEVEISIISNVGRSEMLIRNVIREMFSHSEIVDSGNGRVVASIGDRVDVDDIEETMENVVSRISSKKLVEEFVENNDDAYEAIDAANTMAEDMTSGSIRARDKSGPSRLVLEIDLNVNASKEILERLMSHHTARGVSIRNIFDSSEYHDDGERILLMSSHRAVPIGEMFSGLMNFRDDFPVSSVVVACRPGMKQGGGNLITLGGP